MHRLTVMAAATILAFLAGCGAKPSQSGFLSDYSKLESHPNVDGAKRYINPKLNLARCDKFIIEPVVTHFAADERGATVDPKVLAELTDYFQKKLVESLAKSGSYHVVTTAAPGVVRVRVAITGLKKAEELMNIHPATKLAGFGLGGASVEAEFTDSLSNKVVAEFMHTREGDRLDIVAGFRDWDHAKQAMDFWAELLVERLDEAHGKKAS